MDEITLDDFLAYLEKYGVVSCGIRDPLRQDTGIRMVMLSDMKEYLIDPAGFLAAKYGLSKNELCAELIRLAS